MTDDNAESLICHLSFPASTSAEVRKRIFATFGRISAPWTRTSSWAAVGENAPELPPFILEPQDKLLSGQNRGCGHGDVCLRFRSLLDLNPPPGINQSTQDNSLISELIGERTRAVGSLLQQILDYPGVAPAEQVVQISESDIEFIISFGTD